MEIQTLEKFFGLVNQFIPFHDGPDLHWIFFLKVNREWRRVSVRKFQDVYVVNSSNRISFSHPATHPISDYEGEINVWVDELSAYFNQIQADPLSAQMQVLHALPLEMRLGLMLRRNLKHLMPDWAEVSLGLTDPEKRQLIELLKAPDGDPIADLTAEKYFEYCKTAYLANPTTFQDHNFGSGLSGREYYQRFAHGHDGGLLSLDAANPGAFKLWYHSASWCGTRPWEIYPGGNATHVDLAVLESPRGDGFKIWLDAFSTTRLAETCRIALALKKAGLPFTFAHKESYLKRLLEEDWVGIIPDETTIEYGHNEFPREYGVSDCVYVRWIFESCPKGQKRRVKEQLKKLVHWQPLRISA